MKLIILLCLTVTSNFAFTQWNQQSSGINSQLTDVEFINDLEGFAVGNSKILKTINAGVDWTLSYDCDYLLESVEFTVNKIIVVGYDIFNSQSIALISNDNGVTWIETVLSPAGFLYDVDFPTDLIGYTMGSQGILLKTVDGGNTWNVYGTGISSLIQDIYFHDSSHGFAVGGLSGGYIYETLDGGATWIEIVISATSFLQGIYFSSTNIGYAVGWDGDIFKTINGGLNWTQQTPVQVYGNMDVYFVDDNVGYIVGGGAFIAEIQKTEDGGNTWFSQSPLVNYGLIGVHFPSTDIGYTVGDGGTILNTDNGGGVSLDELEAGSTQLEVYPNPCTDAFKIKISDDKINNVTISIISDDGKIVFEGAFNNGDEVPVTNLNSGVYLIKIISDDQSFIKKLYKQ
ncbi:MAG: photosystem II stability/assembly factor-like uncharacterized protein [Crocinitomicaceae bacterium]|jgi:photosystem II stability/assembly factor-like uncharacterized protein